MEKMPPKIRWDTKTKAKLSRDVAKYNAKITREQKKNPQFREHFPDRMTVVGAMSEIHTRADFRKFEKHINNFVNTKKFDFVTTEKGVKTTKQEIKEIKRLERNANISKGLQRKKANVSTEKGTMGSIKNNNLLPTHANVESVSPDNWGKFVKGFEHRNMTGRKVEQIRAYKENYLRNVRERLGAKGEKLYKLIEQIPAKVLYDSYYDDTTLQINFTSEPIDAELIAFSATERWVQQLEEKNITINKNTLSEITDYLDELNSSWF